MDKASQKLHALSMTKWSCGSAPKSKSLAFLKNKNKKLLLTEQLW